MTARSTYVDLTRCSDMPFSESEAGGGYRGASQEYRRYSGKVARFIVGIAVVVAFLFLHELGHVLVHNMTSPQYPSAWIIVSGPLALRTYCFASSSLIILAGSLFVAPALIAARRWDHYEYSLPVVTFLFYSLYEVVVY